MKPELTRTDLAKMIDHTFLKAYASDKEMKQLCKECIECGCAMAAINSTQTKLVSSLLKDSGVHTGAAISFPLGQTTLAIKEAETAQAIADGADEIDYVVNLSAVKNGQWDLVEDEMVCLTSLCHRHGVLCKVIFETCYLDDEEIVQLARIARKVRPDFIKTSTGFGTAGASVEHVRLMKETVGDGVGVKAAGGIRDLAAALAMIEAGASRIGTSSALKILEEFDHAAA